MPAISRRTTILLLAAAAALQQARYIATATLPAQDVVDVVYVAQSVEQVGLLETIRRESVPPLFPALVAAAHRVGSATQVIEKSNWALPPQWIAAASLVLATIAVFLSVDRLVGRAAAVMASVFFIALPAISRLGGDGLGDALHLCFAAWGTWFVLDRKPLIGGLCVAAALLVRIEVAVVPLTVLILSLPRPQLRMPRFFAAASLCLMPYLAVGITSPADLIERLRGGAAPSETEPFNAPGYTLIEGVMNSIGPDGRPIELGRKDSGRSSRFGGLAATMHEYGTEMTQAFGFLLLPLVVAGAIVRRRAGWSDGDALLLTAAVLHLVIVLVMAWRGGYLSTRHFALPVVMTLPYAAVGMNVAARRAAESISHLRFATADFGSQISDLKLQIVGTAAFVIVSLVVTARPLHESQSAHRQAAEWIASNSQSRDAVLDQQGLTALVSGRPTYRYEAAAAALSDADLAYALVERVDFEADTPRGATLRQLLGRWGEAVVTFTASNDRRGRDVLIFPRRAIPIVAQGPTFHAR